MIIRSYVGSAIDERRLELARSLARCVFVCLGMVMMILSIVILQVPPFLALSVMAGGFAGVLLADTLGLHLAVTHFRRTCHGS